MFRVHVKHPQVNGLIPVGVERHRCRAPQKAHKLNGIPVTMLVGAVFTPPLHVSLPAVEDLCSHRPLMCVPMFHRFVKIHMYICS